jgi:hypothetical protein
MRMTHHILILIESLRGWMEVERKFAVINHDDNVAALVIPDFSFLSRHSPPTSYALTDTLH